MWKTRGEPRYGHLFLFSEIQNPKVQIYSNTQCRSLVIGVVRWVSRDELKISSSVLIVLLQQTLQELRMLSSVTINCQITKIVMNSGSQLSEL